IAADASVVNLRDRTSPVIYVPSSQHPNYSREGNLLVHADHPEMLVRSVEQEIQALGREYAISTKTIANMNEQALLQERATALLSSIFAGLALLLVGIGLFGLMSYTVTRRTREIGIRIALGSQRDGILRMILSESLLLTLAGVAFGLPSALAATQLIRHMLFGVPPYDPITLTTTSIVLLAVGAVAGLLPARKAMKMNPVRALQSE